MDPLKPFSAIVRTVLDVTAKRGAASDKPERNDATRKADVPAITPTSPAPTLQSRLRARIHPHRNRSPAQIRTLFVEVVLAAELGDELLNDPEFSNVVARVCEQLSTDAALTSRLDTLLRQLSQES